MSQAFLRDDAEGEMPRRDYALPSRDDPHYDRAGRNRSVSGKHGFLRAAGVRRQRVRRDPDLDETLEAWILHHDAAPSHRPTLRGSLRIHHRTSRDWRSKPRGAGAEAVFRDTA